MLSNIQKAFVHKIPMRKNRMVSTIIMHWQRCQYFVVQNWITTTTSFLSAVFCSLILYMMFSSLPELPLPDSNSNRTATAGNAPVAKLALLDKYLEPLKTRDLFKPSVPIPSEKKIGKTTAEQLAGRLQFLGVSGEGAQLRALVFIPERGPGSFKVGDRVAEFILKDIQKNSLVLQLENEQITLKR